MFLIGVEFNTALIRTRIRSATLVSVAGIITPFILGGLLILLFLQNAPLFAPEVTVWQAMLFTGAAMSITAFPMLARIIYERGLSGSSLGTLVLAAGSLDDAAAWSLMAIVLASFSGSAMIAISAIGGGLLYGLIVLFGLRRLLRPLETAAQQQQHLSGSSLSLILILLMLAAWFTDFVGIYAVFGAFILGVAMPRGIVSRDLRHLLEPLTTYFLVPLFFIYSGLNTHLNLLVSPGLWGIVVLVVITAVVGKGLACWAAARLSGENNREAMAVGVLMNARGMMELILLNIGLEKGLITETFFTIMVIMAIVTTLITSPLFEWVYGRKMKLAAAVPL
jgi:Kef-type K+ transport system membrane component KefB